MQRLITWWNAYWFPPSSTLNLAGARIVALAVAMVVSFPSLGYNIGLAVKNSDFADPQPLIRAIAAFVPRHVLFTADGLTAVYRVSMIAGAMALVGLFTRTALFVFALGFTFFVSHVYSYADVHHREALLVFFLFSLALAPAGDSLSVDALLRRRRARQQGQTVDGVHVLDTAMWPLKFIHVLLAITYFSTGITKVIAGGLRWMNGYTLQNYIFITGINREIPLGVWMAEHHTLCILLSVGTLVFELFYLRLTVPAPNRPPVLHRRHPVPRFALSDGGTPVLRAHPPERHSPPVSRPGMVPRASAPGVPARSPALRAGAGSSPGLTPDGQPNLSSSSSHGSCTA